MTEQVQPSRPWQFVGIDVVVPLPRTTEGFESTMNIGSQLLNILKEILQRNAFIASSNDI
jgi:hypothetical protein